MPSRRYRDSRHQRIVRRVFRLIRHCLARLAALGPRLRGNPSDATSTSVAEKQLVAPPTSQDRALACRKRGGRRGYELSCQYSFVKWFGWDGFEPASSAHTLENLRGNTFAATPVRIGHRWRTGRCGLGEETFRRLNDHCQALTPDRGRRNEVGQPAAAQVDARIRDALRALPPLVLITLLGSAGRGAMVDRRLTSWASLMSAQPIPMIIQCGMAFCGLSRKTSVAPLICEASTYIRIVQDMSCRI